MEEALRAKYLEDKKSLIKSRDEVIASYKGITDALASMVNTTALILGFMLTFSTVYYAHTPPAGQKMEIIEFLGRVLSLIGLSIGVLYVLWMNFDKLEDIREEEEALRERFLESKFTFEGLSKTVIVRAEDLNRTMASYHHQIMEKCYNFANQYNNLPEEYLISPLEVKEFGRFHVKKIIKTKPYKTYLIIMFDLALYISFLMLGVTIIFTVIGVPK